MTNSPLPWAVAFDMAAAIVKEHDGGCQDRDAGWMSDELLDVWLVLTAAPERYEKMRKALERIADHTIFIPQGGDPVHHVAQTLRGIARAALAGEG